MWVCEKCGAIKAERYDKCLVCSLSGDVVGSRPRSSDAANGYKFPPIIEGDLPAPQVGLPRRYSIGTLMILTVFFALLFGILKMCGVSPIVFIAVTIFVVVVAACQALLYGGKNPRRASFVAGVAMYAAAAIITAVVQGVHRGNLANAIAELPCYLFGAVIAGGPLGYIAGCLVAAIFLVRKEPDETEPPEEPAKRRP